MKKMVLILTCMFASIGISIAQTIHVSGTVLEETGDEAIGASVVAKGTTIGTVTDMDGNFEMDVPADTKMLEVSLIGMKTKNVPVGTGLRIMLELDSELIDEVVVTGYGSVKKASFTGSASVISTGKLENLPTVSLDAKLAGATAGISAGSASGQPGSVESIQIRGLGSVNGSTDPLYVIDGVPMSSNNLSSEMDYSQSGMSILATLNSNDIESITIIKDAAAASLYGSRAANGVVVITTKKGKAEKTTIGFRGNWGFSNMAIDYRPTLNGDKRRDILALGLSNYYRDNGVTGITEDAYVERELKKYAEKPASGWEDWRDRLLRTGFQQSYEVNLQGGNDATKVYASLSYVDMNGITLQSGFDRITGRINLSHKINKFSLGANLTYSNTHQTVSNESTSYASPIMAISMTASPQDYAYNPDGSINITDKFLSYPKALANPLYSNTYNYNKNETNRFLGSLSGVYDIIDGLSLKEVFSYDFTHTNSKVWWDPKTNDGIASNGVFQRIMSDQKTLTSQTHLMYNNTFNSVHNFDALVGYELEKYKDEYIYGSGTGYPSDKKPELENAATTRSESHYNESRMISYIGTANYNYDNKYYLGLSYRRDGSSRFAASKRWGNFWSVSGAWRLTQESFMDPVKNILTDAKLRFSYGTNGNLPYGYYEHLSVFGFGSNYNNQAGSAQTRLGFSKLSWEKSNSANFGFDVSFINRINLTFDVYSKVSKDLLFDRPISMTTGFSSIMMNVGEMTNKGIELELKTVNITNRDFYWETSFNLAHNKNKLTKIDGISTELTGNSDRLIHRVGESFNSLYAYEYAGVDPATGKETFYVNQGENPREVTTDKTKAKQVIIGKVDPNIQGAITNTFSYKDFDLGFTFTYTLGGHLYDNASWIHSDGGSQHYTGNIPSYYDIAATWKAPGDNASLPKFVYGNVHTPSSRWMHSTDHLRLKNVTLGYSLPRKALKKAGISNARVYASAVNLFTIKSSKLPVDPQIPVDPNPMKRATGVVTYQTPALRTVTFGVELSF